MSWWSSAEGLLGDGPADEMADALAKGFPNELPTSQELIDGVAAALSTCGPTAIFNGKHLRFEAVRLPRFSGEPLETDGKNAGAVARGAFAGFVDKQRRSYRERWKRPPRPSEIMAALGFVVGAAPGKYVSDPDSFDFSRAQAGFVDARGAIGTSATLASLSVFVRAQWSVRFDPATSLEAVRAQMSSGEEVLPEGRGDPVLVLEIAAILKQLARDDIFDPAADRTVTALARALRTGLNLQPERYLGGAFNALSELELIVKDPRPRVRHAKFGEGRIVSQTGSGASAKLEIAFADRTCILVATFVEHL